MKIDVWKHEGVLPDGTFADRKGAVKTRRGITNGFPDWALFNEGRREDGLMRGVTVYPQSQEEWEELTEARLLEIAEEHGLDTSGVTAKEVA